jgi:hypothetical protein
MCDLTRAKDCRELSINWGFDGEAVIMRSDFYLAASLVDHWLINSAMTELQFICFESKSATKDLVTKTDSKDWNLIRK